MATIPTSYAYPAGQLLDTDGHNQNVYSADTMGSVGIISSANGGLDSNNLSSTFKISPEHVQVEASAIGAQEDARERLDCFSDAYGKAGASSNDPATGNEMTVADSTVDFWSPVPGCALRIWQPYDATMALWQWSVFFHPARIKMLRQAKDDGSETSPTVNDYYEVKEGCGLGLAVMIDGVLIDHTRRHTQVTKVARDNNRHIVSTLYNGFSAGAYGGRTAQWWDMAHMSAPTYVDAGSTTVLAPGLTRGWHDLQLMVYIERFTRGNGSINYQPTRNGVPMIEQLPFGGPVLIRTILFARATFGIRNARVLTML